MTKSIITCKDCGKKATLHAKGRCSPCYANFWRQTAIRKKITCSRCNRLMVHKAKGLCPGCYNYIHHPNHVRKSNIKIHHNIDVEMYDRLTKECLVCGFSKIVHLHHMDKNHNNTSQDNLVGLCPNHHAMIHKFKYKEETENQIHKIRSA